MKWTGRLLQTDTPGRPKALFAQRLRTAKTRLERCNRELAPREPRGAPWDRRVELLRAMRVVGHDEAAADRDVRPQDAFRILHGAIFKIWEGT